MVPAPESVERDVAERFPPAVGRPGVKPLVEYKSFLDRAASWTTARRVVAKVVFHAGEPFPRVGFRVTKLELPSQAVVRFYNKWSAAGSHGMNLMPWVREACKEPAARKRCRGYTLARTLHVLTTRTNIICMKREGIVLQFWTELIGFDPAQLSPHP